MIFLEHPSVQQSVMIYSHLRWFTVVTMVNGLRDLSISNEEFTANCESVIQLMILQHVDIESPSELKLSFSAFKFVFYKTFHYF